jgi:hypothetical protein
MGRRVTAPSMKEQVATLTEVVSAELKRTGAQFVDLECRVERLEGNLKNRSTEGPTPHHGDVERGGGERAHGVVGVCGPRVHGRGGGVAYEVVQARPQRRRPLTRVEGAP